MSAATTTRCPPLTATRCVSPVVRKSVSAGVPARRRVSPSKTPKRRSPPGPGTSAMRAAAALRTGAIRPLRLLLGDGGPQTLALTLPIRPAWCTRLPASSGAGTLSAPKNSTVWPESGGAHSFGQLTLSRTVRRALRTATMLRCPNSPIMGSAIASPCHLLVLLAAISATSRSQACQHNRPEPRPTENASKTRNAT